MALRRAVEELRYMQYEHALESQYLPAIRSLISQDLSEPYSIYVYRYFLCQWAHLCFMAVDPKDSSLIGVVVCKLEVHSSHSPPTSRGYIAMLAVASSFRGHGVATALVRRAIEAMTEGKADEIVLETEETNLPALRLYERLGFLRSKKLHRYYLNGNSAYRLVLLLNMPSSDTNAQEEAPGTGVMVSRGSWCKETHSLRTRMVSSWPITRGGVVYNTNDRSMAAKRFVAEIEISHQHDDYIRLRVSEFI